MPAKKSPFELKECQELRTRWIGWCGRNSISCADALRQIGARKPGANCNPHWSQDGYIPEQWKQALKKQIGES